MESMVRSKPSAYPSFRTVDAVVGAMELRPDLTYWVLGGHGKGGTLAATLANLWKPKVKGLVLLAAALPGKGLNRYSLPLP